MRHCRSCDADISAMPKKHFLCKRCYGDAARRLKAGEIPPPDKGARLSCDAIGVTPDRVNQLIKLTHPDKHNNSPEANDATTWLLQAKQFLTEGQRHG